MTWLQRLDLSWNGINSSTVDAWFWNVPTLPYLDLSFNLLSGPFPDALQELYLDGNSMVGMIPATLQRLCSLQVVHVSWNQINGDMSEFMDRLPRCALSHVQVLHLSATNMSGELPQWIGDMSELTSLDLSYNNLAGDIPLGIGRLSKLTKLFLFMNYEWTLDRGALFQYDAVYLNISVNQISGRLPSSLRFMTSAKYIYLRSNNFTGSMPLLPKKLRVLDLSSNSLSGPIPSEFSGPYLMQLDVSYNRINGTVPASLLCQHPDLLLLDLSNNNLSGHLPQCKNISSDGLKLSTLILYKNNLSGRFPVFLKLCQAMTFLDLSQNMFYGILPEWIGRKLSSLTHLRLRSNMFSGNIPYSAGTAWWPTTVGPSWQLDIRNQLTGTIPRNISDLQKLESLDLSMNELSGAIPSSLSDLTSLGYLNLSYNNLSGRIPSGNQLQMWRFAYFQTIDKAYDVLYVFVEIRT
ncbi:hypothetical protein PR202_ga07173 [Eleusine coracana subsp. coracana]|uniref:Uncharacterized protein n=1 Tax=Eleusine coracana subsp. coracana TaxID=191504 RepID=A0AAV5BWW7_ELECO|nr:hypothetical protein PR202_ga07173 [Eleusine coracana subsp. coracana]